MNDAVFTSITVDMVDGVSKANLATSSIDALPTGDTLIDVEFSGLNYKDALAITGRGRVLRTFPITPGIDLAGRVASSTSNLLRRGESVFVTGWGIGEERSGGFAEKARVVADWVHPIPQGWDTRSVMAMGTAGLTAMLCVSALERHGIDRTGEVLVTGAGGGVGGISVALLSRLGYTVAASTGRAELASYLSDLGASSIVPREVLAAGSRPLLSERWSGAIDTVGGGILANILAATRYGGAVAACGLAGGADLPATVMPFILRNVALLGVDSVRVDRSTRARAWARLAELVPELSAFKVQEISLQSVIQKAQELLDGHVAGRVVVRIR